MTDPWSKADCEKCGYPHIGAPCLPDSAAVNTHVRQWNGLVDGLDKKRWRFLEWMSTHGRDDLSEVVAANKKVAPVCVQPEPEASLFDDPEWGAA